LVLEIAQECKTNRVTPKCHDKTSNGSKNLLDVKIEETSSRLFLMFVALC